MKDILSKIVIFAVGAGIGSAVTWKFLKSKYERIAQEEIDSVKAEFSRDVEPSEDEERSESIADVEIGTAISEGLKAGMTKEKPDIREYASILAKAGYTDYANVEKIINADEKEVDDVPVMYVISPDDFDEKGYETLTLIYNSDGTLEDPMGHNIGDAEEFFNIDISKHFGEYEDDSVFVRDDEECIDYEVLRVDE